MNNLIETVVTPFPQEVVTVLDCRELEELTMAAYGMRFSLDNDLEWGHRGWQRFDGGSTDSDIEVRFTRDYEPVNLSMEEAILLWQGSDLALSLAPRNILPNGREPEQPYYWQPPTEWILEDLIKRGYLSPGKFFINIDW